MPRFMRVSTEPDFFVWDANPLFLGPAAHIGITDIRFFAYSITIKPGSAGIKKNKYPRNAEVTGSAGIYTIRAFPYDLGSRPQ